MNLPGANQIDQLPHDIYDLEAYKASLPLWVWVLIVSLVLLAAALIYWLKKRSKNTSKQQPESHPLDEVKAEIGALVPPQEFSGKNQAEYYFRLSMAFRRFIELRFSNVSATDLTTNELEPMLIDRTTVSRDRAGEMMAFFRRADLIKFADQESDREEAKHFHSLVKNWVEQLMPQELQNSYEGGNVEKMLKDNPLITEARGKLT